MEREVGGGIGMGNTCKPMAVSFQCMTKFTTKKKKIFQGTLCQGALSQALEALSTNKETTILEYWKSVTICNIIDHISTAWDSIKQATISNCWGNIWPN